MIAERSPQVKQAAVRLIEFSADERVRALYEVREKERRDIRAREQYVLNQGRREEREKWQSAILEKDSQIADKDSLLADKDAEIERLRAQLETRN